jgi:osmoprotectant transport system permease protein
MIGPNLVTIIDRTWEHVYLVFVSMGIALGVALPLGVYLAKTRFRRCAAVIMQGAGVIQTIPSLALIAFIVILFSWVSLPTIGTVPAVVALVLYALLPLLRNTNTGIKQVDPILVEVAQGMGMKPYQVLFQVELPLALPVIMAGIRISTVWTIGIATLCGLIGAGGLGDLIIMGLRSIQVGYLLAGTIPAALLAVLFDWLLGRLEAWLTPTGPLKKQVSP